MKISLFAVCAAAVLCAVFPAMAATPDITLGLVALGDQLFEPSVAMGMVAVANTSGAQNLRVPARARGIMSARNDVANANEIIAELQKTFHAFKEEREAELKGIKDKFADVVQTEKVDRINDEVTKLQAAVDETNAMLAALKVGGGVGDDALDPAKVEYGRAFNQFFRRGIEDNLSELEVKAAISTDKDPDGGYLVPEQMETTIDRVLGTVSAMRDIARTMTISTDSYKKLVNAGGAAASWVGEREGRTETDTPVLKQLVFNAMELYANPAATQKMLDDSAVDIADWLAEEVSIAFAEAEGTAFISGTGDMQPRGILSYDTVANASYSWGKLGFVTTGVAADISDSTHNGLDALTDLVYSIKQGYRTNARFMMNRTLAGKIRKLKTIGDTENPLWEPSAKLGQPATLLGYPITDDDNMSDVGSNAFPVAFGDFKRGYLIVDRVGIRVLRDPFTNKPYVHFYTTKRVGGGVQNFEAIKLLKCAA